MKMLVYILLLSTPLAVLAEQQYTQSDELIINVLTEDDNPKSWLRYYVPNNRKELPITVEFNFDNVRAILITDMNAVEGKCGQNQIKNILYLSFDPKLNLHKITTRINKPCLYKRNAVLKLHVATSDDKRYYQVKKFTIYPLSRAE